MEISKHIKVEAESLLHANVALSLPIQLKSAPAFYLAVATDQTVTAFAAVNHNGAEYKIGPKKVA